VSTLVANCWRRVAMLDYSVLGRGEGRSAPVRMATTEMVPACARTLTPTSTRFHVDASILARVNYPGAQPNLLELRRTRPP
jgi:hypothetical protein